MMRNIRNMFHRASLTEQDIRTFRGMINSMLRWPRDIDNGEIRARVGEISKGVSENTTSSERQEDS
jgi:tRNA/rRNA methyltransferase